MYNTIERNLIKNEAKKEDKLRSMYEDSLIIDLPQYEAELAIYLHGGHALSRIYNRCESNSQLMSNRIEKFFESCSDDVLFELLVASQEMGEFGVYTQETAFVFKPTYFDNKSLFGKKRVSLVVLKTCADEESLGYKFKFKDVVAVFSSDTATDVDGNKII